MQIIYHYCDAAAFFSILKNKKIWLSGINNLNDHQEVEWTIRKIHRALQKLEAKFPLTDIASLWNQIQQSRATPYVCSFSSEGDLLSQWRAYARDGTGFAIGFNADYFPNSGKLPHLSASLANSITTLPVIYAEAEQEAFIEASLIACLQSLSGKSEDEKFNILAGAAYALNGQSTIYKNPAFAEEKEWRIIHIPLITGNIESNKTTVQLAISDIQHRVSAERIVTYFEYDFSKSNETQPVVDIVLGPKCATSAYDLSLFLTVNGFQNVRPRKSAATYR
jgi:hypothetical protein